MFSKKIKGYLSLISAILINFITGNLFSFPSLIPYYQSYLFYEYGNQEKISLMKLYFIAPVGIFVQNAFISLIGLVDKKIGVRILVILSTIALFLSNVIMYFSIEYYLLLFSYVLFGFSSCSTYYTSLRNCWKYFPNRKDLISGIIFSSFGLSSFAFTSIADLIINPDNIPKEGKYYSKQISYRFLKYIKIFTICAVIIGAISSILCFTYEDENKINNNINNDNNYKNLNDSNASKTYIKSEQDNESQNDQINTESIPIKKMILSSEFGKCLFMAACSIIFGFLLANTYRNFGIENKLDEGGMHTLSKVYTLLNTFSRIIWGIICQKFKFKKPYLIILITQIICGCLIYFSAFKLYTYFIVVCFCALTYAGHIVFLPSLIHIKFGVENSVILMGISGIFSGIAALIGPILTIFVKELKDYLIIYLIGVAPSIGSLILTIIIKTEKFKIKPEPDIIEKIKSDTFVE